LLGMGQKGKTIIILTTVLLVVINLLNLLSSRFSATTIGPPHSELKKQGNKESEVRLILWVKLCIQLYSLHSILI